MFLNLTHVILSFAPSPYTTHPTSHIPFSPALRAPLPSPPPFAPALFYQLEMLIKRYFPEGHVGVTTFAPYVDKIKAHEGKFVSILLYARVYCFRTWRVSAAFRDSLD